MQKPEIDSLLRKLWWAGVDAVGGGRSVEVALEGNHREFDLILGVGKAAVPMCIAAMPHLAKGGQVLAVTKYGHGQDQSESMDITIIEAAHPVPDANSLKGGAALVEAVRESGPDCRLLLLVSGGASALAEVPKGEMTLDTLQRENARLVGSGLDIHAINAERRKFSAIKGGGLLSNFAGTSVQVLAISDVPADEIAVIGSGIGAAPPQSSEFAYGCRIVASNAIARTAVCEAAKGAGLAVRANEENLYVDVSGCADRVFRMLIEGEPGVYVLGGEPTIVLPPDPGEGGRNQALAAEIAKRISGTEGLSVLVAGTDGTDGPTNAAGGLVDGSSWKAAQGGEDALARADSGAWLEAAGCRFITGPTGTNVMDLLVAVKQ